MEKEKYRTVIRFLFLEETLPSEIRYGLNSVYHDSYPWMLAVKNCSYRFQRGCMSVFVKQRPGAPKTATMEYNVKKVHGLILGDHQLKACKIAETEGILKDRKGSVLHEILGIRKLSTR